MNHMQIINRSWKILWSYRALWVFGLLVALTTGSGSFGSNSGYNFNNNNSQRTFNNLPPELSQPMNDLGSLFNNPNQFLSGGMTNTILVIIISLCCLGLVASIAFTILRYVGRTALIRMVDGFETSGEKVNVRQGFRLGWSRAAWKLFLVDLLIGIPMAILFLALAACALTPIIISLANNINQPSIPAIVAGVGLLILMGFLGLLVSLLLSFILSFIQRACVLQGLGARDSIRQGWKLVRANLKDVAIMWLLMIGVGIAYGIAMIPVAFVFIAVGLLFGGGIGLAFYAATQGVVAAIVIGLLLFFFILSLPMLFLEGLKETFVSTSWTLAYREAASAGGPASSVMLPQEPPAVTAL